MLRKNLPLKIIRSLKSNKYYSVAIVKLMHGEVFNVAIQRYVQDPKKVESRLMKYAKLLHVEKRLGRYLEHGYKEYGSIGTDEIT